MDRKGKSSSAGIDGLAEDVMRLSKMLTRERETLPASYLQDPGLRKAYRLYFLPANLAKIHTPLRELSLHPKNLLSKERLRVLDVGTGPGTAVLGLLTFFGPEVRKPFLEFTAVDHVAVNLREAGDLFEEYRAEQAVEASLHAVKARADEPASYVSGEYDLVVFSNVLNELFPGDGERVTKRAELLKRLLHRGLAPDGSCIIIEPALRETSRELIDAGCRLSGTGLGLFAPCPRAGLCAVLENPKDWCHEEVPWDPPEIVREIDRRTGLRKDALKFSYLVLRKDGLSLADIYGSDSYRIVSEPLVSKGKRDFYLCGGDGRRRVTRLDKDGTALNSAFETLKRGDIVRFEQVLDEGKRLKVGKETKVELL